MRQTKFRDQVLDLMATDADRAWSADDIATTLNLANAYPVRAALCALYNQGKVDRVGQATYQLLTPDPKPPTRRRLVGYGGVHGRMRRKYGPASDYPCTHCGESARDWAYSHKDPAPGHDTAHGVFSRNEHYIPLCRSCHQVFDRLQHRLMRLGVY